MFTMSMSGGEWWTTRRSTNWPFRFLYRLEQRLGPYLCRLRMHAVKSDIHELDASVWRAECHFCHRLVRAHKPRPADPKEVERWEECDREGEELNAALEAYWAGGGPCPWCEYPDGEHEYTCWESRPQAALD